MCGKRIHGTGPGAGKGYSHGSTKIVRKMSEEELHRPSNHTDFKVEHICMAAADSEVVLLELS